MNLDLPSTFDFGDADALQHFMLDHRFAHEEESVAFRSKFGAQQSTFGLGGGDALAEWISLMHGDPGHGHPPPALDDWLKIHAFMHVQAYTLLGQSPTFAPDLSVVDFSVPQQFYDWMYAHQQMHDFEQASLGIGGVTTAGVGGGGFTGGGGFVPVTRLILESGGLILQENGGVLLV